MAIDVNQIMADIGEALAEIPSVIVYPYPPSDAVVPFAFVDLPETLDYDTTFGRGYDRMSVRVFLAFTRTVDEVVIQQLGEWASAGGANSIKAVLDAADIGTSVRVTRAEFTGMTLAGTDYAGVVFTVDVLA